MRQTNTNADLAGIERKLHRRHVRYGLLAVALSLLLHGIAAIFFPEIGFGAIARSVRDKYLRPVHVETVQWEETSAPPSPAERIRAENPNMKINLPGEVSTLRKGMDEVLIEPRLLPSDIKPGETRTLGEPKEIATPSAWQPRREILEVQNRIVADSVKVLPRRLAVNATRGPVGPDIVTASDRSGATNVSSGLTADFERFGMPGGKIDSVVLGGSRRGGGGGQWGTNQLAEAVRREVSAKVGEQPQEVTQLVSLDKFLTVDVETYNTLRDLKYEYCRIAIRRLGPDVLPVLPKDIAFVQDCSASMTEQKLHFCRDGLIKALAKVGPEDGFNVFSFRDTVDKCFPTWVKPTPGNIGQATRFIQAMRAVGNTDVYGSLHELLDLERVPGRPLVAMVASDGAPTVGETSSSKIIAEFSRDNAGAVSVFTLGPMAVANRYLLDFLGFQNRGDAQIVTRGRWDVPDAIASRVAEVSRPVLMDVSFRFSGTSEAEAYPALMSNLYLDRSMVIFCRYPRRIESLLFQAVGRAGPKQCDMIFDIDLSRVPASKEDLRKAWAAQKIYYLIGEHAKNPTPVLEKEIADMGQSYGIKVPYRNLNQ